MDRFASGAEMVGGEPVKLESGVFTVSLDFELYWGVRDKRSIAEYRENLLGVRGAISELLKLFSEYGIHATWATVGFLFFKDSDQLKRNLPVRQPQYLDENLSPYQYIENNIDLQVEYHFAPDIIESIRQNEGQEIGTHTFCHYYCLTSGQSLEDFSEDLSWAVQTAKQKGITIKSLVFPRNDCNPEYLPTLTGSGVVSYRGNATSPIYQPDARTNSIVRRGLRLLDSYLNISGHNTYDFADCIRIRPYNFPASLLLRPYSKNLDLLSGLKLRRITKAMDHAAKERRLFHLWWHPHNFGVNTQRNISFLRKVLEHYKKLQQMSGFVSMNMGELGSLAAGYHE